MYHYFGPTGGGATPNQKEEREACAVMCDEEASSLSGVSIDSRATGQSSRAENAKMATGVMERMALRIRARSS